NGWMAVRPGEILGDGDPISEADARKVYEDELMAFGNPPPLVRPLNPLDATTRWFHWGWSSNYTLGVVRGAEAWSLGPSGWRTVRYPADVVWDGWEISEHEARRAYADRLDE